MFKNKIRLQSFTWRITTFLICILFCMTIPSFAQEPGKEIPDGTQGEVFRLNDTIKTSKYSHWNEFENSTTTLRFGGGLLFDGATYIQDDNSKKQFELTPDVKVRDARVTMSGIFKSKREITWKAGIMFDGASKSWFMRETGVMVKFPEISGHIFLGRTKEGFSMSKVMNGYSIWNMERTMALDVIPILSDGIKYMGYLPKQHIGWNIGIFTDWLSNGQSFSTFDMTFATRIFVLPIYTDEYKPVLHVGISYRYGSPLNNQLQIKSRPETNPAPYFVDTKTFPLQSTNQIGGELYFRSGQFLFGSEYYFHKMTSIEKNNPLFLGGEAFIAYSLTGEVRGYMSYNGIFTFLRVKKSVFQGGPGAWEAVMRVSNIDYDDQLITGGRFWRITPTINWYLSNNVRFTMSYGYGVLNRFDLEGKTHFFQGRILFML